MNTSSLNFSNSPTDGSLIKRNFTGILPALQIISVTWYSLVFLLGIVGNGLVIWIAGFKMKKTVSAVWFLNLAAADFCFCLFLPLYIVQWVKQGYWPFGNVIYVAYVSVRNMSYCSVSYIVWENISQSDIHSYILRYIGTTVTRFASMFLIPFIIFLICFGLVVYQVRKRNRISVSSRTLHVVVTIVTCFFLCWILYHLFQLMNILNVSMMGPHYFIMFSLANYLAYFNSCINPMIYIFFGWDFKEDSRRSIPFILENMFKDFLESSEDISTDTELVSPFTE
ncbi:hypothetical protein GDO86_012228 [Hymenochirus boettgeri]|uniref:G-protein coupled receptors family 1 profile domain-containing protein n=1 Tax=Hymenochirus boettgeri TaxID=247094 RepID=A0A8T2IPU5_9PIPI|nr:hypothetical protein GDO86_012228 [Hymenochirus boettgeri]